VKAAPVRQYGVLASPSRVMRWAGRPFRKTEERPPARVWIGPNEHREMGAGVDRTGGADEAERGRVVGCVLHGRLDEEI
jgi:hypothetical protein